MGEGLSGRSVESGSFRSPFSSTLMLQSAVSPDIASPALTLMVQITLSLNVASHVPANFFGASASCAERGRQASRGSRATTNLGMARLEQIGVRAQKPSQRERFGVGDRAWWSQVWTRRHPVFEPLSGPLIICREKYLGHPLRCYFLLFGGLRL